MSKAAYNWTSNLKNEEQKKEFISRLKASKVVLDRLSEILNQKKSVLSKTKEKEYEIANWPYFRADRDGYIRCLDELLSLINIGDNT